MVKEFVSMSILYVYTVYLLLWFGRVREAKQIMFMYLVFDKVKSVVWYLTVYFLVVPQTQTWLKLSPLMAQTSFTVVLPMVRSLTIRNETHLK